MISRSVGLSAMASEYESPPLMYQLILTSSCLRSFCELSMSFKVFMMSDSVCESKVIRKNLRYRMSQEPRRLPVLPF